jgi:hypothetical protein
MAAEGLGLSRGGLRAVETEDRHTRERKAQDLEPFSYGCGETFKDQDFTLCGETLFCNSVRLQSGRERCKK